MNPLTLARWFADRAWYALARRVLAPSDPLVYVEPDVIA